VNTDVAVERGAASDAIDFRLDLREFRIESRALVVALPCRSPTP